MKRTQNFNWRTVMPLLLLFSGLGVAGYLQRGGIKIEEGRQAATWYEMQEWANNNTPI
ncbi:MAG: hypothetical protein U5L96_15610 [Owenweeksia sp.]|nr:hypothetical protein [Owenweeksia sp.]